MIDPCSGAPIWKSQHVNPSVWPRSWTADFHLSLNHGVICLRARQSGHQCTETTDTAHHQKGPQWSQNPEQLWKWKLSCVWLFATPQTVVLLFSSISLHWSLKKAFLSLLAILWNVAFRCLHLSFSPLLFASLIFTAICKASPRCLQLK